MSANSTPQKTVGNKGDSETKDPKKSFVLTAVLTRSKKRLRKRRFQSVAHGLFRFKKTGMLYAVFKSAGRTRWKNLGTDDTDHARELLADEIKRATKLDWKKSQTVNLRQLVERYETNPMNLSESTFTIRLMLLDVFKDTWGYGLGIRVREVKLFMLKTWLAEQRKERKLKSAGLNNYLRMLHGLFEVAVELGAISENPAKKITLMREECPERLTPTWEQAQQIVAVIKKSESKMPASAMLLLGLGQGELGNLMGEHFDFERGCLTIRRQKTQKVFIISIFPHAQSFVETLKQDGRLQIGKRVFPIHNPREAITLACKRLNLPSFTPRSLRRAFIIHTLERGVDPRVVAAWQGYRDATLILRVYGSWVNQDHAQRMAALMN